MENGGATFSLCGRIRLPGNFLTFNLSSGVKSGLVTCDCLRGADSLRN